MVCSGCPSVPLISQRLANKALKGLPEKRRHPVLLAAMRWLAEKHSGLACYSGIVKEDGPYPDVERMLTVKELGAVAILPCPFHQGSECLIGELPKHNRVTENRKPPYSWLPTWVAVIFDKENLKVMVKRGEVANAKSALLSRNERLM